MTKSRGWTAEVGGWKSEIRDRRLENRGWGAGCTEERAQIRVRQHGQNKRRARGAKSGNTATLGCAGMFDLKRTGRSACATRTTDPPSLPRTGSLRLGSLRLRSGQAGQVREDGAPAIASPGANSYHQSGSRARHRRAGSRSAKRVTSWTFFSAESLPAPRLHPSTQPRWRRLAYR